MDKKAVTRQIMLLGGLAVIAVVAIIWSGRRNADMPTDLAASQTPIQVMVIAHTQDDTLLHQVVRTTGALTALRALEEAAGLLKTPMAVRQYDFGKLVVSIGGLTSGDEGDWTYRVNGEFMPVGTEACILADGDTLEFIFGSDHPEEAAQDS